MLPALLCPVPIMKTNNQKSETKTETIRFRVSDSGKNELQDFAAQHNTSMSAIITASIQATLSAPTDSGPNTKQPKKKQEKEMSLRHQYFVESALRLDRLYNLIVSDPNIPDETKEKLLKEINTYGRF